jgi:hypothetical protein
MRVGGRQKGTPNRITAIKHTRIQEYFEKIVDDKREAQLWDHFMTDREPNPVNWQAFKRAVEYKRGMPVQPHSGEGGGPIQVQLITNSVLPEA